MTSVEILSSKRISSGDTSPPLRAKLYDEQGDNFNLTGYSVTVSVTEAGADSPVVDTSATILQEGIGIVKYNWQSGDTDESGAYLVEFVADDGTETITFPSRDYAIIIITE